MLKIIDVDWVADYTLTLTFNDGFEGLADFIGQHFELQVLADWVAP